MRVGFIGLGQMGGPMSGNVLAAGHDLIVHDIRPDAAAELVAAGARWADTPLHAAADREIVITSLPGPRQVEEVLLGQDGLLDGLEPGAIWADMSTSVPAVADLVRQRAEPRGVRVIDAPVSGMTVGAKAGTLQVFVGGTPKCSRSVSGRVSTSRYCGTASLASPAASHFLAADVLSVLNDGDYDEGFALALACKDLGLAVDLARATGVPAEVSALVEQIYRRARAQYGDLGGEMLPMKLLEDLTGRPLRLS